MACKVTREQLEQMRRQCDSLEALEYVNSMLEKYYGNYGLYTLTGISRANEELHTNDKR